MVANSRGPRHDAAGDAGEVRDDDKTAVDNKLPEDLTVSETIDWVSNDKSRAKVALKAEQGRDKPRTGVTEPLEALINNETGAGVASGEA